MTNICKCDEELAYELTQAADKISDQFVTNLDGSGFDHASQCGSGGNQVIQVQETSSDDTI